MRRAGKLETVAVIVPSEAVAAYEAAIGTACSTVGIFATDDTDTTWRVEGVKAVGEAEDILATALQLAAAATGIAAPLHREATPAEGWLARVYDGFPEQRVGQRFTVRGTHLPGRAGTRITLTLDAGLAFGSGEHGSTRGCLRALERVAHRQPRRMMDMGTGSGILAIAAAKLLRRAVAAVDNDPWAVRVAAQNAAINGVATRVFCRLGRGWLGQRGGYDLVFANILARPLCAMAQGLARHLAPGGRAILAGLTVGQIRMVLAAHRRQGLVLERVVYEAPWATLILRKGMN